MAESNLAPLADESVKAGTLMPLVSLRKHYKISLCISAVIILLGVPFAWFKGKSYYSATAVIYVAPRMVSILQENREQDIGSYQQYKQYMAQQTSAVTSYEILLSAFEKLGELQSVWKLPAESERRAVERLQGALAVKSVSDTYLFTVTLESDKARGLDEIVNTVVQTYVDNARSEQLIYASKERMQVLYDERQKLESLIAERKKQLGELSQEISITTFAENTANPYDKLLADSQSAFASAQRDRIAAEAALSLFENPANSKTTEAFDSAVSEIVYKDPGLNSLKANMYMRRSELVRLISGLSPEHPGHTQIKNQLERIEAEVVEATSQLTESIQRQLLEDRRSQVELTSKIERQLLEQIDQQKEKASWFATKYNSGVTLNQAIKRYTEQLQTIDNRISFMELESKAPGFIRIESKARPPEIPIRGGRTKLLVIFMILGPILGFIVPIVLDMFDKRIKTAGQVEKLLGYKPLAELREPEEDNQEIQKNLANQMRHLVLALERERQLADKPFTLIMLTAVEHNSAVTSLALELANDYKIVDVPAIVVEVNLLSRDQRYMTNQTSAGLLNLVLEPDLDVTKIVSVGDEDHPNRIAIGMPTDGLLFGYHRLQAALEKLGQYYPVIILDTAPILNSADSEFFASISDITLVLIAIQQTKPDRVKQAVKLLERIDPKVIGFLVTRIPVYKGVSIKEIWQHLRPHIVNRLSKRLPNS